jgi:hypothetical protein
MERYTLSDASNRPILSLQEASEKAKGVLETVASLQGKSDQDIRDKLVEWAWIFYDLRHSMLPDLGHWVEDAESRLRLNYSFCKQLYSYFSQDMDHQTATNIRAKMETFSLAATKPHENTWEERDRCITYEKADETIVCQEYVFREVMYQVRSPPAGPTKRSSFDFTVDAKCTVERVDVGNSARLNIPGSFKVELQPHVFRPNDRASFMGIFTLHGTRTGRDMKVRLQPSTGWGSVTYDPEHGCFRVESLLDPSIPTDSHSENSSA